MRIIQCEQGSAEWFKHRIGIPTASCFDKIITKTGKASAQADKYLALLAAEWFLGECLDTDSMSKFMERGRELEPRAAGRYEWDKGVETVRVGLCVTDDGKVGASPDRLVGDDGLLEIKCPSAAVHMTYLLGGVTDEYRIQCQGQLWVTGRKWCDLYCWHPTIPAVTTRIERDEKFIEALGSACESFVAKLDEAKARLAQHKAGA